ncbi:hypothetical protein HGRIS_005312 [Hohenbuehelia grisea]
MRDMPGRLRARGGRMSGPLRDVGSIVDVYWHVISVNGTREGGDISDSEVADWMGTLNEGFGPVGLSFKLAETRRITNAKWYDTKRSDTANETAMVEFAAPHNDAGSLKIFSIGQRESGKDGISWAADPRWQDEFPNRDGLWLNIGAPSPRKAIIHEVGHWCGLRDVFGGGCKTEPGYGDMVDDTPPQDKPTYFCDKPVYSCGRSTPDPNDNYMNLMYDDSCRKRFTPGQIKRMREQLKMYRGITLQTPTQNVTTTEVLRPSSGAGVSPSHRPSGGHQPLSTASSDRPSPSAGHPPSTGSRHSLSENRYLSSGSRRPSSSYQRPSSAHRRPSSRYQRPSTASRHSSSRYKRPSTKPRRPSRQHIEDMWRHAYKMFCKYLNRLRELSSYRFEEDSY